VVTCSNNCFKIYPSNIFDEKGSRLIGLYKVRVSNGFSGFVKRIILEDFYNIGKYENLSATLNM